MEFKAYSTSPKNTVPKNSQALSIFFFFFTKTHLYLLIFPECSGNSLKMTALFSDIQALGISQKEKIKGSYGVWADKHSLVAQMVKNLPAVQETKVQSLGWEDPLEKAMAMHSSILACRIPWTEEPGGLLESLESQSIRHD